MSKTKTNSTEKQRVLNLIETNEEVYQRLLVLIGNDNPTKQEVIKAFLILCEEIS